MLKVTNENGSWPNLVGHQSYKLEVVGSNPTGPIQVMIWRSATDAKRRLRESHLNM